MSKHTSEASLLDYQAIGRRIREARKKKGLTQEKLAETVDLSPPHMSHIESGKTKLSLASLILLANALDTTVDCLLHDNVTVTLNSFDRDFKDLLDDCTSKERHLIYNVACEIKNALHD